MADWVLGKKTNWFVTCCVQLAWAPSRRRKRRQRKLKKCPTSGNNSTRTNLCGWGSRKTSQMKSTQASTSPYPTTGRITLPWSTSAWRVSLSSVLCCSFLAGLLSISSKPRRRGTTSNSTCEEFSSWTTARNWCPSGWTLWRASWIPRICHWTSPVRPCSRARSCEWSRRISWRSAWRCSQRSQRRRTGRRLDGLTAWQLDIGQSIRSFRT